MESADEAGPETAVPAAIVHGGVAHSGDGSVQYPSSSARMSLTIDDGVLRLVWK